MSAPDLPPPTAFKGPAELVLAAEIARLYYLDGMTKVEIADQLRLSRFRVARLLQVARQEGVVRIEIQQSGTIDLDRSIRLRERFGLEHVVVVDCPEGDPQSLRSALGRAAADLLGEVVGAGDLIGLAWARCVQSMVRQVRRLPQASVVQLTGVLPQDLTGQLDEDTAVDIVRDLARVTKGPAYLYFAPFLVPDAATALALRRQPEIVRAFGKASSADVAVVGIGRWAPGLSTLYQAATPPERTALAQAGVCAEMAGICLAADGEPLHTPFNERMISVDAAQFRAMSQRIAIPYGSDKHAAVLAALRSGLVTMLVTHSSLAEALLTHDQPPGSS
ncbi:MAG: sugar-binding domain-containing protein [Micropruina sp.]|uniref:sugar-binding transcriptional regulator n=1 Tax=Micropruina sp. TaxID=2737536 RepID=UPI0039E5195F